jgi:hypothetical protein
MGTVRMLRELSVVQLTVSPKMFRLSLFAFLLVPVVVQRLALLPELTGWSAIMQQEFLQLPT